MDQLHPIGLRGDFRSEAQLVGGSRELSQESYGLETQHGVGGCGLPCDLDHDGVDRIREWVAGAEGFGGTQSNLALSVMNGGKTEVVAGINLPMLIKLASCRQDCDLDQAVVQAQDAGRKYINVASRVLAGKS